MYSVLAAHIPRPSGPQKRPCGPPNNVHFLRQIKPRGPKYYLPINQWFSQGYSNSVRRAYGNFLKRLHVGWFKYAESCQKIIIAEGLPSSPAVLGYASPAGGGC